MSHESMIATIEAELKGANIETLGLLLDALRQSKMKRSMFAEEASSFPSNTLEKRTADSPTSEFIGENLKVDDVQRLSVQERGELQRRLKEQNHAWLRKRFASLNAFWIMVVDGQVKSWGRSKKDYPHVEQIMEVCESTGKYPFIFINDDRLAIEESSSSWYSVDVDDFYPTIPLTLQSDSGATTLIADFDTGSPFSFVNYDLLLAEKVVKRRVVDYVENAIHLGKQYQCVSKIVTVEFEIKSGETRAFDTAIYCVEDWAIALL